MAKTQISLKLEEEIMRQLESRRKNARVTVSGQIELALEAYISNNPDLYPEAKKSPGSPQE